MCAMIMQNYKAKQVILVISFFILGFCSCQDSNESANQDCISIQEGYWLVIFDIPEESYTIEALLNQDKCNIEFQSGGEILFEGEIINASCNTTGNSLWDNGDIMVLSFSFIGDNFNQISGNFEIVTNEVIMQSGVITGVYLHHN